MYIELSVTADYGNQQAFIARLVKEIGVNAIPAALAVSQTVLYSSAANVVPKVIAAEQIQDRAIVLYFLSGGDTITAHIEAGTVAEEKKEAVRITRRLCTLFERPSVKSEVNALIYAFNSRGFDTEIIEGKRIGHWRRLADAFRERWLTRVLTPGIVFGFASTYFPQSNLVQSALIVFAAAIATLLIESIAFAVAASDWEWKEK